MHQKMAATLDEAIGRIRGVQRAARASKKAERPRWPMIVLRSPKGWTGPKEIKGHKAEGSWRSHQVPFSDVRDNPKSLEAPRNLAEELQAGGAVRQERPLDRGAARARLRRARAA